MNSRGVRGDVLKLWGCSMALAGLCICLTASVHPSVISVLMCPYVSDIMYYMTDMIFLKDLLYHTMMQKICHGW